MKRRVSGEGGNGDGGSGIEGDYVETARRESGLVPGAGLEPA